MKKFWENYKFSLTLLLGIFVGAVIGAVLVLLTVNLFPPESNTTIEMGTSEMGEMSSISDMIVNSLTVSDFNGLFTRQNMLPIILAAILTGLAVAKCGGEESPVGKLLANMNQVVMKLVDMIMKLAPIGLGAYFANLFKPVITAFATSSSCAALPANMETCEAIGVPSDIYNIVLPLGCTMHMDGSVLSSITKIAFLFGIFGVPYTGASTYALSILVAVLSAFVLSGAPGGGLVGEMIIVNLFGFPAEAFPIIATIGFLVDPAATCLNSSGDAIASMIVTRFVEGKDWMEKKFKKTTLDPETAEAINSSCGCEQTV